MKANNIKKWVLFIPNKLSSEESSWWENWTSRIIKEYDAEPILYTSKDIFNFFF